MIALRRIKVHQFRNVVPGCELELMPGINVVLGQNGTGKTTLLIWVADLLTRGWRAREGEPFDVELELQSADVEATFRLKNTLSSYPGRSVRETNGVRGRVHSPQMGELEARKIDIDIRLQTPENQYQIEWRAPTLSVQHGDLVWTEEPPSEEVDSILGIFGYFEHMSDAIGRQYYTPEDEETVRLFVDQFQELSELIRFDESLGMFSSVLGKDNSSRLRLSSWQSHLDQEEWGYNITHLLPDVLGRLAVEQVERASSIHDLTTLTFKDRELHFLDRAVEILGFESAELHCMRLESDSKLSGTSSLFGEFWITFTRHDGGTIHHNQLSYGQKRMLAFLWYLEVNKQIIVVDELVNGLHHAWIEHAIEELGSRQAVLTSQNPLLLDYLAFESADEVRRRFILCRLDIDPDTRRERWIWRNPNEREAESFYSAYRAGIQHVGEILMDKGLW